MADTRTHEPKDRDELDRALRRALEAAQARDSDASVPATPPDATRIPARTTPGTGTLGSFTFRPKG